MFEKAKTYLEKVKAFLKKVPKKVYIALVTLLAVAVALVIWLNTRPYEVLFTGLNTSEMSSILTYLDDTGVTEYKVENNDTILVPQAQEASLKARLLMEGYPQTGFAYSSESSAGMLSTESERREAAKRDLQDRLSAVVRCFDGVRDAVVTIEPGEDRSYVLDSGNVVDAKASVFVTMEQGKVLTDAQADAIRTLVAHSVKSLDIDSVQISDAAGNTYNAGNSVSDSEASALKLQLEQEWENKIRTNVLQVLIPYYGEDNVRVGVNCTVDISQTVEDSTDVHLPDWADDGSTNGRGIVGSRIYNYVVVRDGEETAGGVVGTSTNSDIPEYVEDLPALNGDETSLELSGQVDYNNSETKKHVIRTAGYLADCMIAVSINSTTAGSVNVDEMTKHVARAAGITGAYDEATGQEMLNDKVSVIAQPFYEEPAIPLPIPNNGVEPWMLYAGVAGLVLFFLILLLIVLLLRRHKKKKKAKEQAKQGDIADIEQFLAAAASSYQNNADNGADVMSMQSERSIELRQDIRKFAEDNPEIAAQMLRGWLRGDDE